MRRVLGLVGIAALVVLMTMTVGAQQKFVRGTVTAMAGDQLTVKVGAQDMTFTVEPTTNVVGRGAGTLTKKKQEAGQKTVLTDFVGKGDDVIVNYTEKGGAMVATEVRVTRKAAK